ncbi:hypothetical protein A3D83_00870 [Candidatus Daviesbacteria bacterium RIFCSPHIGHO2_02_FULL_41_10]|uniref:LTD domain-containing protein n=1 Tax=Candidatus Daviesbacteria bacterium RIFCSPHIGHO2_02_FULL_41_10 TaxID=1797774 RepID=A0A1F5JXY5_9BACT|nr:MAG: hypothetical protein A3D83_00870 [Candidatus Daviesbacteria bacterium RIFCSPHIGHO2_02_FULL_41_10]
MRGKLLIAAFLFLFFGVTPVFASSVFINEFFPHPSSGNKEWVEFYNKDGVDLSSYWIDDDLSFSDDTGSSAKKSLSSINKDNLLFPYFELSSFLNDPGDYVVLFSNDGNIVDQYQYTSDPGIDKSIGRIPDGDNWIILSSSSKGSSNGDILPPSPTPTPTPSPTPSPTPTASSTDTALSSFIISNAPSQINSDQSFKVNITLSMPNNPNTEYYLKGEFKKSDGTRYLGLTKKDSDWIEYGDDLSDQYKITTDASGNWSGNLEVKPDVYDKDYKGSGQYLFKIGRYTAAGSGLWSNPVALDIVDTTSSPTPSPSGNPTPTPSTTKVTTTTSSPKPTPSVKISYQIASVAGTKTFAGASASSLPGVEVKNQKQINPMVWTGLFSVLIGTGSLGYIYLKKNGKIPF